MGFNYRETQVVKGMLLRGDKQHDIASYFGVNGGRVAEVSTGDCDYPNAAPLSSDQLPPPGPYLSHFAVSSIIAAVDEAIEAIDLAANATKDDDAKAGLAIAKEMILEKIKSIKEV